MPTTYTDQFFTFDPANPPGAGTAVSFVNLSLTDQNDDLDFDRFDNDSVNGSDITASWPGDTVTIFVSGVGNITYTGVTFYLANGDRVFTPDDGQVLQNGTFVSSTFVNGQGPLLVSELGPPCFTKGALILTQRGLKPVETLREGDMIQTRDNGFQPLNLMLKRSANGQGQDAPIRFAEGAMGYDHGDLIVSPQHRMLINDWRAELWFGEPEVLVAAKFLVNTSTIRPCPTANITYYHLLMDRHDVISANGVPSESFDLGGDFALYDRQISQYLLCKYGRSRVPHDTARKIAKSYEGMAIAA